MEERGARERVDALLDKAAGLGAGSLRLAVLSGNGERVVDGTALQARAELRAWLAEALGRHRFRDAGGRFRVRLLDGGGRAVGSVVIRGDAVGASISEVSREERHVEIRPAPVRAAEHEPTLPTVARTPTTEGALREARARIAVLERELQTAARRAQEASAAGAEAITRLRAEVRELEQAAGRASTTAGDTRRELASAQAVLALAQRDARRARARADATEVRAAEVERTAELRAREVEEREQRAIVRADGAEKRVASLEGELRQVPARAVELEGATAVLREKLGALRAENERLRGVVLRQHATIDNMSVPGAPIAARVDELFGDEDEDRSRRRR